MDSDNHFLKSISDSISRARALLMTMSVIAAWALAGQIITLIKWQNIRTPASYNFVIAAEKRIEYLAVTVPFSDCRGSEQLNYIRDQGSDGIATQDLKNKVVLVEYPVESSVRDKMDWCRQYFQFILDQCKDSPEIIRTVELIIDRSKVSEGVLPQDVIKRPNVTIPVIGMSASLDDINIMGAVLLSFIMIWFKFALDQIQDNVVTTLTYFSNPRNDDSDGSALKRVLFFKSWLPTQFLFIRPAQGESKGGFEGRIEVKSEPQVYSLFFVPYLVVVSSLCISVYDILRQLWAFESISGKKWTPFIDSEGSWSGAVPGIIVLRWCILILIAVFLARLAWQTWMTMHIISDELETAKHTTGGTRVVKSRLPMWRSLIVITALPVIIMSIWGVAQKFSIDEQLKSYGWTYGTNLTGSLLIVTSIVFLTVLVRQVWKKNQPQVEFVDNSKDNDADTAESH